MLPYRANQLDWDWMVYLEMFVAGVAAGAYATAALLEANGRGNSPVARTAHLLAFPLVALAGGLLAIHLGRPERFWHMLIASEVLTPILKIWSPMSFGSWLLTVFGFWTLVSFVDALVARRRLTLWGWRADRTLHGSPLGLVWSAIGAVLAFFVGSYSGVLLNVTNFPGWGHSIMIGAMFVATTLVTGMAAVLLIEALRRQTDWGDVAGVERATVVLVAWQLLLVLAFIVTLGRAGLPVFFTGGSLIAILLAIGGGIVVPLILGAPISNPRAHAGRVAVFAALILVGGLLLRAAVVMGPQHG
jgi:formate-dependent nitrite reductase membrane component NrfD